MDKNKSAASKLISAGPLMDDQIVFEFAIYYLPEPSAKPQDELDRLLKDEFPTFKKLEKITKDTKEMALAAQVINDVKKSYAPPSLQSLQYFGRGLSREQAVAVQNSKTAFQIIFSYPKEHVLDGMRSALQLTGKIAKATNGLVWDEETRLLFSVEQWNKDHLEDWTEEYPDISKHITVHAYKKDEYVRAITLGMSKFGLPDIVVDHFSWSISRNIGHIINLFAQSLIEGAVLQKPGEFDLDLKAVKNTKVREPQVKSLRTHATGKALLTLSQGVPEEGDPNNRIIAITFERYPGPDVTAKQNKMAESLFGWDDKLVPVQHDQTLEAASRRARAALPALRKAFNAGLAPGEFISVKAPFETPNGGQEYMWVEVTSWKDDQIKGLLRNEPFKIPTLHAGQNVEVSESKIFDYIRRHADGTEEGNETGKLIDQQSGDEKE